jgi:hypothetical protein
MTAEGPATVTLTDAERRMVQSLADLDTYTIVERIVAARVAALTADLATAREHVCPVRECFTARRDLAAARLARSVLMDELNDMTRDNDERARVIANVRALANEWREEGESLVRNAHSGRDVHEGMTLVKCADAAVALLPAAPTGEGS